MHVGTVSAQTSPQPECSEPATALSGAPRGAFDHIAVSAGFGTPAAMRQQFHKALDTSPAAYRRTFRELRTDRGAVVSVGGEQTVATSMSWPRVARPWAALFPRAACCSLMEVICTCCNYVADHPGVRACRSEWNMNPFRMNLGRDIDRPLVGMYLINRQSVCQLRRLLSWT